MNQSTIIVSNENLIRESGRNGTGQLRNEGTFGFEIKLGVEKHSSFRLKFSYLHRRNSDLQETTTEMTG